MFNVFVFRINPITGCVETESSNSQLDDMTEEQKEYEANKLVNLIDQMQRTGIVQPCRIGPDGKPEPIEHVLQLREHLQKMVPKAPDSDSDSD